jgi:Zn-finger nucleic acid-binding protein
MWCPVCKSSELDPAGYTWRCARCDGAWVEADVLVPLLEERVAALVELEWKPGHEDHVRVCPVCTAAMATVELGTVALDRCPAHGVWFDARKLAALLKQAKSFRAPETAYHHGDHGLLHRLGRLLHGDKSG